jgi:hypothetical protein
MTTLLNTTFERLEATLFSPDQRVARAAQAGLFLLAAAVAALLAAVAGPIYSLAAFGGLTGGLLILRDLRWGYAALFAVIGLAPFAALPFKIGFTPTFLDLAILALYLVWILRVATRRQRELVGSWLGVPVFVFLLMAVFAFANGLQYHRPTATTIRNFAELALGIGSFFLVLNTLRRQADLNLLTRLIILAGAGAAAIAVLFYVIPPAWTVRVLDALARLNYPGGYGALRYIEDDAANPMRAIGTMVDPNVLGGFLILVAGLTAPQVVSRRPLFHRSWAALFLGLELLALYLTYSRGSLVGLAAGLFVIGALRYRRLLLIGLAGIALLLLLPQAQAYVGRFIEGIQLQDRATLMRLGEYRDALALISRYPWFGVGFSGSPEAGLYVGVSNVYLLIAEEMGVIGLACFLIVMAGFVGSLFVAWRKVAQSLQLPTSNLQLLASNLQPPISTPQLEALLLGLMAAVVGVAVGGIFDHYLFNLVYPHMSTLFWIYLGLGMSATLIVGSPGPVSLRSLLGPVSPGLAARTG